VKLIVQGTDEVVGIVRRDGLTAQLPTRSRRMEFPDKPPVADKKPPDGEEDMHTAAVTASKIAERVSR
jgi:hypothetical protein